MPASALKKKKKRITLPAPILLSPSSIEEVSSGSGASRVHSTTLSGSGSPEATPRVKGSARSAVVAERALAAPGKASTPAAATAPPISRRRDGRPLRGEDGGLSVVSGKLTSV